MPAQIRKVLLSGVLYAIALTCLATLAPLSPANADEGMQLVSSAFADGGQIPSQYTCQGEDISPPLAWNHVPARAKSLALIVEDPDAPDPAAPRITWIHWVLYNIPADAAKLPQAVAPGALPKGTRQGRNGWGRTGYGGPCPPIGRHRYFFKLYALNAMLPNLNHPTKGALEQLMLGHIVAEAELMGTYQKGQ